jgi:ParB family chromosome partitioning protein
MSIETYLMLDKKVDEAEGDGIMARWEFGRELLTERVDGKLPVGRLSEVAEAIGKSRSEVSHRLTFAEKYPTEEACRNAITTYGSWFAIVNKSHVSTSGENEWYTPPQYLEAARRVMGGIDLDPASSDLAQELVQATVYYTKDDDGLTRPWSGRVWMNPPYSKKHIWPFCERLCEFVASGDVTEAVVLVNNATETAAFQRMAELAQAMCFHAKRIKYLNVDLVVAETPVQGQAFIYFGENAEAFHSEFVQFGFTVSL